MVLILIKEIPGLEELIRTYDRELNRKQALETKASILLGAIAISISLLTVSSTNIEDFSKLFIISAIISIVIAICYLFKVISVKKYRSPLDVEKPNKMKDIVKNTTKEHLIYQYSTIIWEICEKNTKIANDLKISVIFVIGAILLSILALLIHLR